MLESTLLQTKSPGYSLIVAPPALLDLDSLAGTIGYRHCLPPSAFATSTEDGMTGITTASIIKASHEAGLYIATAAADRIDMFENLSHPNEIQYAATFSSHASEHR